MIVEETKNVDEIKAVLCDPRIYDVISDDESCPLEGFEPPIGDEFKYILGIVDREVIALMVYHELPEGQKIHIQVLPEHRKKHAVEFAKKALEFADKKRVFAEISEKYQNVIKFAKAFGFVVVDKVPANHRKNNVVYDSVIMRLT